MKKSGKSGLSIFLLGLVASVFLSCTATLPPAPPGNRPADNIIEKHIQPAWAQDGLIYELFIRDFTPEGTFQAIIPRLDEIRDLGVETIWLMPIHPIGEIERKGSLGSPYSISDYYAVNPDYGSAEDFHALVDAVHAKGMHLIIDLVINHTAWDNPWITEHPDWYTKDDQGNMVPPVDDWTDVADLNYGNPDLRAEMIRMMQYWVRDFDIDGYRVDTASMVPRDFWEESIPRVQEIKPVLFLGESGDVGLNTAGYQLIYGWSSYSRLKDTWRGGGASVFVAGSVSEDKHTGDAAFLRFITNHDETAWDASPVKIFHGQAGAQAAAVAIMYMPGVPLIYNGQEIGNEDSWAFFDKWNYDWSAHPEVREFYRELGSIWQARPALRFGDMRRVLQSNSAAIISYVRRTESETVLVLVNKTEASQSFTLPDEYQGSNALELFSGRTDSLSGEISFLPFEYRAYRLEN